MQIHELNNFNGTPGATNFLAIDNGSDTARISGEALLDPVNSRIDNLTANVLPDSVETILDWADVESASKTLTKNVSGFDYLDLYFKEVTSGTNRIVFAQRYPRTAFPAQVTIPVISWGGGTDPKYLYLQDLMIAISGTTLTMSQLRVYSWDGKAADGANIESGILVDQIRVDGVKISSNTSAELTDLRTAHNGTVYASARAAREADYNALDNEITPVANEVNNIRIGADGATYPSAGDAVRSQAAESTNRFNSVFNGTLIKGTNLLDMSSIVTGKYVDANGTESPGSPYNHTDYIPVEVGKTYTLQSDAGGSRGLNSMRFIAAYDSNKTIVPSAGKDSAVYSYDVPDGVAFLIISASNLYLTEDANPAFVEGTTIIPYEEYFEPYMEYYIKAEVLDDEDVIDAVREFVSDDIAVVDSKVEEVKTGLSQIADNDEYIEEETAVITPNWSTGFLDGGNGQLYTGGSYDDFRYSQKITVTEGDIISLNAIADGSAKEMRCVVAYSGDTFDSSASKPQGVNSYTVPDGIDGIIITTRSAYAESEIHKARSVTKEAYHIKIDKMGYMTAKGNLSDGETLKLLENNSKNSNVLVFTCRVSNFNSIKIGKNINGTPNLTVNGTNVIITNSSQTITLPHGLTIADDLQVIIETTPHNNRLKKVVVSSRGIDFINETDYGWFDDQGEPYVTSIGSTLTDCVLSWTSRDINKPIWIFGDSYVTYHNTRWPYYLAEDGYDESSMINGYSGEASAQAYIGLNNLLTLRVPKMVVWCLGMNNGDSDSEVNSSWKEYYDKVINLSKRYGFELILYATPTTPTVNNDFKNAIVRASGYRYIDIDAAVRLSNSRNWINGLLSSDEVHPTIQGGKVIYHRFLADLPELTSK